MIATKVDEVYEVELPTEVKQFLNQFALGVSFGFSSADSVLQCLGLRGYINTLKLYVVAPFVVGACIVGVALVRMLRAGQLTTTQVLNVAYPPLLKLNFLAYPLITNAAFEAFSCYDFAEGDGEHITKTEYLKADVSIQCYTAKHDEAVRLAWTAIGIYPLGVLFINALLLWHARHAILNDKPTARSLAVAFLYREYEPSFYWWELVEMIRRFVLVGLMVLFQDTMMQLVVGTTLSAAFLLFQVQVSPYKQLVDDYLASAASFCLVVIFLCSIAFKYASLVDLDDIREKMSREQRIVYIINQETLTLILIASVFGAIVLSLIFLFKQVADESVRRRRESLASKARRLRYRDGNQEVTAPPIGDNGYHLFLSHVWGTGQDQMRIVKQRLLEMMPGLSVFLDVDDLEDIANLGSYIERTDTVLIFCSKGYFQSKNCMIEMTSTVTQGKPILALMDPEANHGGLNTEEVHKQLLDAEASYPKWGFDAGAPLGEQLFTALYAAEYIEWNRIGAFQDVTMRLIAHRLLTDTTHHFYVQGELVNKKPELLCAPASGHKFHVFCSPFNQGAPELMVEVGNAHSFDHGQRGQSRSQTKRGSQTIKVTDEEANLTSCDAMLLYLTGLTWTSGEQSAALAKQVSLAMDLEIPLLLAHEMPGIGGQAGRHGCEFGSFFACPDGATPQPLLSRGIYAKIAIALKGGAWREASLVMLAQALITNAGGREVTVDSADADELARLQMNASALLLRSSSAAKGLAQRAHRASVSTMEHVNGLQIARASGRGRVSMGLSARSAPPSEVYTSEVGITTTSASAPEYTDV